MKHIKKIFENIDDIDMDSLYPRLGQNLTSIMKFLYDNYISITITKN